MSRNVYSKKSRRGLFYLYGYSSPFAGARCQCCDGKAACQQKVWDNITSYYLFCEYCLSLDEVNATVSTAGAMSKEKFDEVLKYFGDSL